MNNIVLNIPHSSLKLPKDFFKNVIIDAKLVKEFNEKITDLYTFEIFANNKYPKLVADYSRIFCDVEKFADDEKEVMSKFGMGFVYTKTCNGEKFIEVGQDYKNKIYKDYYLRYHNRLDNIVEKAVEKNTTILIDCHSFSKEIIMFEDKKEKLPDICIGFDNLYYNEKLIGFIQRYFEDIGLSVKFNYPYTGTIIPNKFLSQKVDNLFCVMIEINKEVYLSKDNKKKVGFKILKKQVQELLKQLENLNLAQ